MQVFYSIRLILICAGFSVCMPSIAQHTVGPDLPDLRLFASGSFRFASVRTAYWGPAIKQGPNFLSLNTKIWVPATLYLPSNVTRPVPAMVVVHGIGGLYTRDGRRRAYWDYAAELAANGIAAVIVDTHGARGLGVADQAKQSEVPLYSFVADAFAAADMLRTHPAIDASRIGIMGFSKGGAATLLAVDKRLVTAFSTTQQPFRLHIAIYPGCQVYPRNPQPTGEPVRMLLGEKDNYTGTSGCREIEGSLQRSGGSVSTKTYPGAYHSWDEAIPTYRVDDLSSADCRWYLADSGEVEAGGRVLNTTQENQTYLRSCLKQDVIYAGRNDTAARQSRAEVLELSRQKLLERNQ